MIGLGQNNLPDNVYLFKNKNWTPFETTLRYLIISDSRASQCSVAHFISDMVSNGRYPMRLGTPTKVHTTLFAYYRDEVIHFFEANKDKLKHDTTEDITNLYFMSLVAKIAADYGVDITKFRKQ